MMKQAKQRKVPIWAKLLIVLLVIVIVFLGGSYGIIRFFTGDALSLQGILAMAGYGGFDLPDWYCEMCLGNNHEYENLPDILTNMNGQTVVSEEDYRMRRQEMLELYEECMYGPMPTEGFTTSFEVMEEGSAFGGKAIRRQVKITVSTEKGSSDSMMLIYMPANKDSFGIFVGENFSGNLSVSADPEILPSTNYRLETERGADAISWPIEEILDRGYAVATAYYGDFAEDSDQTYQKQLLQYLDEEDMTAFTAWAFGISRMVDYIAQIPEIDMRKIASVGHSRLARVSLWAGVHDERIQLVSASCGGGSMRSPVFGKIVTNGTSNHWFNNTYFTYEGRDVEMPVDMNLLFACVADRHLYISMGTDDLAADPLSMVDMLQDAKRVWRDIYGKKVIEDAYYYDMPVGEMIASESVGLHIHNGGHYMIADDWNFYMDYMDQYMK